MCSVREREREREVMINFVSCCVRSTFPSHRSAQLAEAPVSTGTQGPLSTGYIPVDEEKLVVGFLGQAQSIKF